MRSCDWLNSNLCRGHKNTVFSTVACKQKLYSGGLDGEVKVWNLDRLSLGCIKTLVGHKKTVSNFSFIFYGVREFLTDMSVWLPRHDCQQFSETVYLLCKHQSNKWNKFCIVCKILLLWTWSFHLPIMICLRYCGCVLCLHHFFFWRQYLVAVIITNIRWPDSEELRHTFTI